MISFIVATTGRETLARALASIETWPGDEILLVGDAALHLETRPYVASRTAIRCLPCPPGRDWGMRERTVAMPFARGRFQAYLDDDDAFVPQARALFQDAMDAAPDRPTIFRMQCEAGHTLWTDPVIRFANLGTPMLFVPNVPNKLGQWGQGRYGGDFHFAKSLKWAPQEIAWRPEVIAMIRPAVPA